MQFDVELFHEAQLERAAVAFAHLDTVTEQHIVGDVETVHRAAPRKRSLTWSVALPDATLAVRRQISMWCFCTLRDDQDRDATPGVAAACPSRRDKNVLLIAIMFQPSSVNGHLSVIFQIKKPTGQVGSWFGALLIRSI